MSEQGKYVSRSKERQSWSWLVAENLVNFLWYLLYQLGLGPRLGSGESAITWSGVPMCWVVKMSVECVYVDLLDCSMNWWTSCWSWVWVSVLVVVKSGVTDQVWYVRHDRSVMMAWKSVGQLASVEGSPYSTHSQSDLNNCSTIYVVIHSTWFKTYIIVKYSWFYNDRPVANQWLLNLQQTNSSIYQIIIVL